MPTTQYHHISTTTFLRLLIILGGAFFLYLIRDVLGALFFAIIIASAIEPAILTLKKYGIPRIPAVVLIYTSIAVTAVIAVYLVFPLIVSDIIGFTREIPALRDQLLYLVNTKLPISTPFITETIPEVLEDPTEYFVGLRDGIIGIATTVFGGIFTFILIIIFSFYLAIQERGIEGFLRLIVPLRHEAYMIDLWDRSQQKLGRWFRAQLLLGVIVGLLVFVGLTFLGIQNALFFAFIAGLFEIIPVAGPLLAAVPAVLTALLVSPFVGLLTIALYVAVQQIESHLIIPLVMRRSVGLNPLVVVLALLIGGKLAGVFGILLAVPIAAIVAELIDDWDKKKRSFES